MKAALESGGFQVVAEAGDASGAYQAAVEHRPDVCLLDIHMPGNGIKAAARIVEDLPGVAVIMLTVSRNDEDLFDSLRVGASGYLLKDIDPDQLPNALRKVLEGEAALPSSLVTRLVDEFRTRGAKRKLPIVGRKGVELTSKEWEVLDLMRESLSTAEIGERLFISTGTVRSHVSSILKKLRVSDRKAAVKLLEESE